jgi:hypothetical protein
MTKGGLMALHKTWYSPEDAVAKFGVPQEKIMEWVEQGLVRNEREDDTVTLINVDDLKIEVENYSHGE